jgi:hypothetical protein
MPIDSTKPEWDAYDLTETNQDHILFEDLIVERCDIYGLSVDYYILNFSQTDNPADPLYGENPNPQFLSPVRTKINYMPQHEDTIADVFGITNFEIPINITIPKYTFTRDTSVVSLSAGYEALTFHEEHIQHREPMAGDLIHFLYNGVFYEVVNVCHSETLFLGKKLYWELKCKEYKLTESMSTSAIDAATTAEPLSAWGDNDWLDDNRKEDYSELPDVIDIYGYK